MITFKSTEDLNKLSPDDPSYPTVKELIEQLISAYTTPDQIYDWEAYGYVILLNSESEVNGTLDTHWDGCSLLTIPWEGIMLKDGYYIGIWLANNEYGEIITWAQSIHMQDELKQLVEDLLDPLPSDTQEQTHEQI
jgi:hypothetical protein